MQLKHSLPFYNDLINKSLPLLESIFPKKINTRDELINFLQYPKFSKQIKVPNQVPIESFNKGILDPCWSMLERRGKMWRPTLGLITSNIFIKDIENIKKHEKLYQLLYLSDCVHNASLIIDDIEDKSSYRRGKKCVHLLYGEDISINAGFSLMIFPMNKFLSNIKRNYKLKGKIVENFLNELTSIHLGQGWDMATKCDKLPQIDSYIDTVLCKTGVCPRLIVKMAKIYIEDILKIKTGNLFNEILDLCDDLSIGFQIWDDLMNLVPSTISHNKQKIGEDITEGKLTIMVLHSLLGQYSNKGRLKEILVSHTQDQKIINEAISILQKNGSIKFSEDQKDFYIKRFEQKCNKLMDMKKYSKYNIKSLNALIELKNTLIKV
jgi:geranylgeranyl pyrophosphate synthase